MIFFKPIRIGNFLPTAMGEIAKNGKFYNNFLIKLPILDIFGQFYPLQLVKNLPIRIGLKKLITKMGKIH
jgi:hypothetical protein